MTKVIFVLTFSGFLFQQLEVQSSEIAGDYSLWVSNVAAISHFAVMQIWSVSHEVFQPRVLHYMNIRSENYAGNKIVTAGN